MNQRPLSDEYAKYYEYYIKLVPDGSIIEILENQRKSLNNFFLSIKKEKENFRYSAEKWSVKELIGHVLDSERIFAYRALRISRNDTQPLLGFDENEFAAQSNYKNMSLQSIVDEFDLLRASNILLFKSFSDEMWLRIGTANNNEVSVRAIAYILAGHAQQHANILKERYNC